MSDIDIASVNVFLGDYQKTNRFKTSTPPEGARGILISIRDETSAKLCKGSPILPKSPTTVY